MTFKPREELAAAAATELRELLAKEQLRPKDCRGIDVQEMPCQPPLVRARNMLEVALGYTTEQARLEALRCLQCRDAPCIAGCPVGINIPAFIKEIAEGNFASAVDIIKRDSLLPSICGRVCPQEKQCQLYCTVGKGRKDVQQSVSIGRLERFVADWDRLERAARELPPVKPETGKRVGIIGSGPASITVAADVRREGHAVTMFEAFHKPGGVMLYGIPEFRLPKQIVEQEVALLEAMGVEIKTNFVVGRTRKLMDLLERDGYDAIFVGSGAGLPRFMSIPGENFVGVFSANEYLTRANLMRAFDRDHADTPIFESKIVAVLGGGNVAMDAARTALRIGAKEVHVIYRRTEAEMPARVEEVNHAREEGVQFHLLQNAKRILGDDRNWVRGLECVRYELGEPDDSGRRSPVERVGSNFEMELDTVIVAIGNDSNPLIRQTTPGLEVNSRGNIVVDEQFRTSIPRVFAGGDIVLGAATVILAMGQGRRAATAINEMLSVG